MEAIDLANLGLLKLGITQSIEAMDEDTREAYTSALVYDHKLRQALRRFPWPFATKYRKSREDARHTLELCAGPFWDTDPADLSTVAAWDAAFTYEIADVVRRASVNYYCILSNVNQQPPNATYWSTSEDDAPDNAGNGDWTYAYRWPEDCLFVRRVVPQGERGRQFNPNPIPYRIGRDENGLLIYTNEQEAEIEYTMLDCEDLWSDDLFLDAFTWLLASIMAPSLERAKKSTLECYQLFEATIRTAQAVAMQESQQEPEGAPDWIRGR